MPNNNRSRQNTLLLRECALFGVISFVAVAIVYIHNLKNAGPISGNGFSLVVGKDFLDFWMYGRAAHLAQPWRWYDIATYNHALSSLLGTGYLGRNWSYPPSVMLLAAPFGLIGFLPALLLWTACGLIILTAVIRQRTVDPYALIAVIVSPAALFCFIPGQNALLTSAILVGVFSLLDRRPIIAGILIGMLTLKPHVGVLFPVVLIASSRWRVLITAAVTTIAIAACTAALFGLQSWVAFVNEGIPRDSVVLLDAKGVSVPFYPTIFMNLHGMGVSYSLAFGVQAAFALAATVAIVWAFRFRRDASPLTLFALLAACTNAALPYLLVYDTLPLTIAALLLLADDQLDLPGRLLARFIYWLPLLQIICGVLRLPGPALVAPIFAFYLLRRMYLAPACRIEGQLLPLRPTPSVETVAGIS
jgi:hypothetical protein